MSTPVACTIRSATADDLDLLAQMGAALVRLHHGWDAARFFIVPELERGYRAYFASQLGEPETVILVAEVEEHVAGYVYGSLVERDWSDLRDACGKVHDLFVEERARAAGVGQALLEEAVRRLEALGAPRVVLMVAAGNPRAREIFARAGFRETMIEMTREAAPPDRGRS
jgi:ribosomal protein S18 acetylase RimI-like enzyme